MCASFRRWVNTCAAMGTLAICCVCGVMELNTINNKLSLMHIIAILFTQRWNYYCVVGIGVGGDVGGNPFTECGMDYRRHHQLSFVRYQRHRNNACHLLKSHNEIAIINTDTYYNNSYYPIKYQKQQQHQSNESKLCGSSAKKLYAPNKIDDVTQ